MSASSISDLWLYHPKPQPDELLSSWLVRIAHGHSMKIQTFSRIALGKGQETWNRDIDRQAPDWLVGAISKHTGVSEADVLRTSLLTYQGTLYPKYRWSGQQYWLLPLNMIDTSFQHHGLQYCPLCLAQDPKPYFRKRWRIALYTMCTKHQCMVHDRCPECGATVAFHRREMGKFSQVNAGSITLCHSCDFNLCNAPIKEPIIYNESAYQEWLPILNMLEQGGSLDSHRDAGYFAVLHQMCKILVSHVPHGRLQHFVADKISAPKVDLLAKHDPFEHFSLEARHIIIQMAMWLMVKPEEKIIDAWRNRAIRYSVMTKDMIEIPLWYRNIVEQCADWRGAGLSPKIHSN